MAKLVVVGTQDVVGATVVSIDGSDVTLIKDGRKFYLELELESSYNTCMCDGPCCCYSGYDYGYLVARAEKL